MFYNKNFALYQFCTYNRGTHLRFSAINTLNEISLVLLTQAET